MRGRIFGVSSLLLILSNSTQAITIPVTYQLNSWVTDGVPTPVATPTATTTGLAQNINDLRDNAQTFTTTTGFTLDKIWIHYQNVQSQVAGVSGPGTNLEVRLFKVTNPTAATLSLGPNLFSVPQTHVVPFALNPVGGAFAIFDVENITIDPTQGYALQLMVDAFPYQWSQTATTNVLLTGAAYRTGAIISPAIDQVFALQEFVAPQPPTNGATIPEPASLLWTLGAVGMMMLRHRRV